jgi:hypothetical protein
MYKGLQAFLKAIEHEPSCPVPELNGAIVAFALREFELGKRLIDGAVDHSASYQNKIVHHKALLWQLFYEEQGYPQVGAFETMKKSRAVVKLEPSFGLDYYALRAEDMITANPKANLYLVTRDTGDRFSDEGQRIVHRAMSNLLLLKEYSEYVGGYPVIHAPEARLFPERFYMFIREMLPPYMVTTLQEFYRGMIENKQFSETDPQAKRFCTHNDPPTRFCLAQYRDMVERLMDGKKIKPTYTYFGSYYGSAVLYPHRDRLQCEFTLSVNIDINPVQNQCPLGFYPHAMPAGPDFRGGKEKLPNPEDRVYAYHRPGDGVLIKGREITHWRDQMPPNFNCSQFFLHYVFDDFSQVLG